MTDFDWRNVPGPVRERIATVLPVAGTDALDSGTQLIDEGGESRWKNTTSSASTRVAARYGVLQDALEHAEEAAKQFDDGSDAEATAEGMVDELRAAIGEIRKVDDDA